MKPSAFYRKYLVFLTLVWRCRYLVRKASDHSRHGQAYHRARCFEQLAATRQIITQTRAHMQRLLITP